MSTTYYTDSTPPATYPGDYATAIAGVSGGDIDRMQYALWQDDTTWDAWVSWAKQNAYVADGASSFRTGDYSSWALSIKGNWSTIEEGSLSFMCINDSN